MFREQLSVPQRYEFTLQIISCPSISQQSELIMPCVSWGQVPEAMRGVVLTEGQHYPPRVCVECNGEKYFFLI